MPIFYTLSEVTGPSFGPGIMAPNASDLTRGHSGEPLGERIIVSGRVLDEDSRSVVNTLVEIWPANAAGRYRRERDQHPAPVDANFSGSGTLEWNIVLQGPDETVFFDLGL